MAGQRIRIRLKAYDHRVIDASASEIVETVKRSVKVKILNETEETIVHNFENNAAICTLYYRQEGLCCTLRGQRIHANVQGSKNTCNCVYCIV